LLRNAPGYVCPIRTTLSTTAPIPREETHGPYTPAPHATSVSLPDEERWDVQLQRIADNSL
jgi:hypothetical protein